MHGEANQRITAPAQRTERHVIAALALAAVILALQLAHPHFIGHDDGIYAALGASLASTASIG